MLVKLLVLVATAALINGANIPKKDAMPLFKHDALKFNPLLEQRTVSLSKNINQT